MKRLLLVLGLAGLLTSCTTAPVAAPADAASAAATPGQDSIAIAVPRKWQYLVQLPPGYERDGKPWPLVVFLHGSGERGTDLQKVAKHGPPKLVAQGRTFPFILVSPQCPDGLFWSGPEVDEFVAQMVRRYHADPRRVYLTGLSLGGYGVWETAIYNPSRYAALVPICGGGYSADLAGRLKDIPIWAFHGAKDPDVPLAGEQAYVEAVNAAGGHAIITIYPETGHDAWTETYDNPAVYEWMLAHTRREPKHEDAKPAPVEKDSGESPR
jgi:predicted peptidase